MKSDSLVPEYSGLVLSSPWSLPEQKALGPEPEITTTLISESLPASSRASDISSVVRPRMALYTSGAVDGYPGNPIFLLIQDVCVSQVPSSCFYLTGERYGIPNGAAVSWWRPVAAGSFQSWSPLRKCAPRASWIPACAGMTKVRFMDNAKDLATDRSFQSWLTTERPYPTAHLDSRLRGNDGMRFSGLWKGPDHPQPFDRLRVGSSPRIGVRGRLSPIEEERL